MSKDTPGFGTETWSRLLSIQHSANTSRNIKTCRNLSFKRLESLSISALGLPSLEGCSSQKWLRAWIPDLHQLPSKHQDQNTELSFFTSSVEYSPSVSMLASPRSKMSCSQWMSSVVCWLCLMTCSLVCSELDALDVALPRFGCLCPKPGLD